MRRLRHLAGQHRTTSTDGPLDKLLADSTGLQNARVSKIAASTIRTIHTTGAATHLGKLLYWNRVDRAPGARVRVNLARLRRFAGVLLLLSLPPLWHDLRRLRRRAAPQA